MFNSFASIGSRVAPQFIGEDDRFGHLPHGFTGLPALPLQGEIGLLFIQRKVALQNSFRAFDDLSSLQLLGQRGVGFFQARQFAALLLGSEVALDGVEKVWLLDRVGRSVALELDARRLDAGCEGDLR